MVRECSNRGVVMIWVVRIFLRVETGGEITALLCHLTRGIDHIYVTISLFTLENILCTGKAELPRNI